MTHAPALANGDVLGQPVTMAVDRALRDASTAVWAGLSATGFVGPGASILSTISAAINNPVPYVWQQFQALRRQNTLTIAGILTGRASHSARSKSPIPEAVTAFGGNAVVMQRLVLKVAADTPLRPRSIFNRKHDQLLRYAEGPSKSGAINPWTPTTVCGEAIGCKRRNATRVFAPPREGKRHRPCCCFFH